MNAELFKELDACPSQTEAVNYLRRLVETLKMAPPSKPGAPMHAATMAACLCVGGDHNYWLLTEEQRRQFSQLVAEANANLVLITGAGKHGEQLKNLITNAGAYV